MASRHLARAASSPADYEHVYREVLARAGAPVVLHWLGAAFDPQLAGYFGATDVPTCIDTLLRIMGEDVDRVRGIKMSLLDAEHEIALRSRLPEGTSMFTGDDYNYVGLIEGDGERHSDALLGAFAAVAPNASAAIQALDARRSGRLPADPRADRGAGPARLRGADLLLQDRRGVPVLVERSPAGVQHGRRPAVRAQSAPPVHSGSVGRCRGRIGATRACDAAVERLSRAAWCRDPRGSARMSAHPRLSLNQATIKYADLPTALSVTAESGIPSIGLWREPVAEVGLPRSSHMVAALGSARLEPLPRRVLHRSRRADGAGPRWTTTGGRSTETAALAAAGADRLRPRARSGRRRSARRRPGSASARSRAADAVGALVDDATAPGCGCWPSSRCTRSTPPTAASSPPSRQALDIAEQFPARRRRRRRRHLPRRGGIRSCAEQIAPRRTMQVASPATRSATGSRHCRPTRYSPAGCPATATSTSRLSPGW